MPNIADLLPWRAVPKIQQYAERGLAELHYLRKIIESGAFRLEPPLNYAAMAADIRKWGEIGMLPSFNARRTPNRRGDHRRRWLIDLQRAGRGCQRGRSRSAR